jgi:hypothetical protein
VNEPEQTAAYRRLSCLKLVSSQQRMMAGTEPRMNRPGASPGGTINAEGPKPVKLFARPDVMECTECPAELCRPSDLCE